MPVVKLEEPALVEVPKVKEQPKLPLTYLPLSSFDPCTTLTPKRQRKLREAANQNSQELLMQFLMATAPLSPGLVTNSTPFCNLFTIKHHCKTSVFSFFDTDFLTGSHYDLQAMCSMLN